MSGDADESALRCPGADIVVKRSIGGALVAANESAAVDEYQDRARSAHAQGTEHIEAVALVRAVSDIAFNGAQVRRGANYVAGEQSHACLDHGGRDGSP